MLIHQLQELADACVVEKTIMLQGKVKTSKAIPVTGRGGLWGCEMLRVPHFLVNRLIDAGKFVSPMHRTQPQPWKVVSSRPDEMKN
jgi:hypothetical protein